MFGLALPTVAALVVIAFLAGIGITAIGPGGVFLTIALFALTSLSTGVVAGTASATFIATGILGSLAFFRSGDLRSENGRRMALVLSVTGIVGAFLGALANAGVSQNVFGVLLGVFVSVIGLLTWYRERAGGGRRVDPGSRRGLVVIGLVGLGVGFAGGLLGVGGPVLVVPLLVALGVALVPALAVAQVQSIFLAAAATVGYASRGVVSLPLVLLVGIPELLGVVIGWRVAHSVDAGRLKLVLAGVLVLIGPYLAFGPG